MCSSVIITKDTGHTSIKFCLNLRNWADDWCVWSLLVGWFDTSYLSYLLSFGSLLGKVYDTKHNVMCPAIWNWPPGTALMSLVLQYWQGEMADEFWDLIYWEMKFYLEKCSSLKSLAISYERCASRVKISWELCSRNYFSPQIDANLLYL